MAEQMNRIAEAMSFPIRNRCSGPLSIAVIEERSIPEPNSGCWLWLGNCNRKGYGRIARDGRNASATRAALELSGGAGKAGECALHRCDNPTCVNPDHLFWGTLKDNAVDMSRKGRAANTKLSPEAVREIRNLRTTKRLSFRKLAAIFGVNQSTIRTIVIGESWSHV